MGYANIKHDAWKSLRFSRKRLSRRELRITRDLFRSCDPFRHVMRKDRGKEISERFIDNVDKINSSSLVK